jgi:cytochrome b561
MANTNNDRYARSAVFLHWIIAILIVGLIGLGYYMVEIPRNTPERAYFFNLHKSLGVVAFVLIVVQIVRRFADPPPPLPLAVSAWEIKASRIAHWVLYFFMVAVPLSGYVSSSFSKYGVHVFGLKLPHWGWDNKELRDLYVTVHSIAAIVLIVVVAIHALAAFKHLLIDKDKVLQRMLP